MALLLKMYLYQHIQCIDYLFVGLDALEYQEHMDYDVIQSTNPEFNKAIVRLNVYRDHRQTVQVY